MAMGPFVGGVCVKTLVGVKDGRYPANNSIMGMVGGCSRQRLGKQIFETLTIHPKDHALTRLEARPNHSLNVNRRVECLNLIKHLHLKTSFHDILLGCLSVVDGLNNLIKVDEDKVDLLSCRCGCKVKHSSFSSKLLLLSSFVLQPSLEEFHWLTLTAVQRQGSGFEDRGRRSFCFMSRAFPLWSDEAGREARSTGKDRESCDLE